jgi:hypothetical protein
MLKMPENWDDHSGWEAYYSSLLSDKHNYKWATTSPGSFSFNRLGSLIDAFHQRGWLRIWFPGCGFSPLPRVFASYGFTAYATDIAPTAVEFQKANQAVVETLTSDIKVTQYDKSTGSLIANIHDFRESFGKDVVDVIFNIKSLQGLPLDSMKLAVQSHLSALCRGNIAFFDTMNIQGKRRDRLEQVLVDVGFYVPLFKLNQWYRQALGETGIPYVFVLGSPIIPQTPDYPHEVGTSEYERDRNLLGKITKEYRSRMEIAYEEEQSLVDDETKHAQVIYSTG